MFNQNNEEEKKLDWMYKGPNSTVSRDEYLLGRSVDKTLEQLNEEEKQKQSLIPVPKNRVEHECIPPSIRDFNKLVQAEQVDLSTKLQEDPLVAIKKREEESRRQFLQNPVQLKKLQKALKAQQAKKKKKSKQSSDSDSDLEKKLAEKLFGKKNKKVGKDERQLDTILIHKFEALKDKLSENDLQDILNCKFTDSDGSSEDEKPMKSRKKRQESSDESEEERKERHQKTADWKKKTKKRRDFSDEDNSRKGRYMDKVRSNFKSGHDVDKEYRRNIGRHQNRSRSPYNKSSSERESESKNRYSRKYDSDDSDSSKNKKVSYGLVSSDGKKIPLSRKCSSEKQRVKDNITKVKETTPPIQKRRTHKLTEEEKEKLRQQMMENAVWRDKERVRNVKKHREREEKERKEQSFDPDFIHKQLLKSTDTSSVESRIKSNLNNIQRSSGDMDKHFSRR